ncbi:hypothetical protein N8I74_09585 [Chitiniphilus purpureus]|uniref:Uncharacterized protein n=1 Tax=Chitiniphilus purpureus TaxID=2981137 RepID=A0ABY6DSN5_9NEIS|nr:hypothetical protein [Chitiniphilus sp. CD1]UXY17238.1 hypothetical protein N8I74_09585 [Chitiniphilus sp. CD1]
MSATTVAAKTALKQADDGINGWLHGLITGKGDSPSQIIVTAVLGVVPGVGQVMDARDIILSMLALTAHPANPAAWLDLVINALGCIPGVGDAFKAVFKLAKVGTPFARILDVLPARMKGNAYRWVKEMDFGPLGGQLNGIVDNILSGIVHALDTWATKALMGRGEIDRYVQQLLDLRKMAAGRIDAAVNELKKMHGKLIGQELPKSTARTTPPRAAPATGTPRTQTTVEKDRSTQKPAQPGQARTDEKRQARKKDAWYSGVLPEHLADYHIPTAKAGFRKINDHGRKREEHDGPKGQGIDHIWYSPLRPPTQPYVIAETKGSLLDSFALLQALPAAQRAQLESMKSEDPFDPAPQPAKTPGKVSVPETANDDDLKAKRQGRKVEQGLSSTKTKGVQMSHKWIIDTILGTENKGILSTHQADMRLKIEKFRRQRFSNPNAPAPYDRWIIMVTGKQKVRHEPKHGHHHEIKRPLIELPNNILPK